MRSCLVCGDDCRQHSSLPGLLRCHRCGFVTAALELSRAELEALYREKYFRGGEYRDYVAEKHLHEKHFSLRLRLLRRYIDNPNQKALFEIGCAYGFFLALARAQFGSVSGIDISADAVEHARNVLGLNVMVGDFLDMEPEQPEVVCLWDTIEHLPRPDLYFEKLSRILKSGSIVAVTTGDIDSAVARWRGPHWRQIHPPTHLHYFSKQTLAALLTRHGFDICYSGYQGTYRSFESAAYIIFCLKRRKPYIYEMLKSSGLLRFSFYLNLYDIVFMVGRKR